MSDQTQGGVPLGDQYIDLDLGGVDAIQGWMPVPGGVYTLQIDDAKVVSTKDGHNRMIEMKNKIVEGSMANRSLGIDNLFIPNRETQSPESYDKTAGFFKGKIEAITGRPYAGRLNVREMVGMKFKAIVLLVDSGYGPQNEIRTYLPLTADTSGIVVPASSAPRQQSGARNGGGAAAPAQTESPGRFKI